MAETVKHPSVLDTGVQHLGAVYAKALLAAADDADIPEQVLEELDAVVQLLAEIPQLDAALASPRVPLDAKESMLDKAFGGRVNPMILHFLKVVCRRRRFDCIRAVQAAAHRQLNELAGRVTVHVTAAAPLDEGMTEAMVERLEAALGKRVILRMRVDPGLIGGLVVRVGDTRYDASLIHQLQRLRESAVDRVSQAIRETAGLFEEREQA